MRKAQHKGKRVLASALCVGMLASMVPTQAFAANEQPVAAVVQEAAPAAEEALAEDADPSGGVCCRGDPGPC